MNLLAVLRHYSKSKTVVIAILLGLLSGASGSAILNVVKDGLHNTDRSRIWKLVVLFAVLAVVTAAARMASSLVLVALGARSVAELQRELSRKILGSNMRRLEEMGPHRLMVTLTNDISVITTTVTNLPVLFINAASVVGCLVYMAYLSWVEMLVVLASMVIGIPTYMAAMRAGARRQMLAREVEDDLFSSFKAVTQGTKELKMRRGRRQQFMAQLDATSERYRFLRVDFMKVFLAGATWGNLLFYIAMGVVLFGWQVDNASGVKTGYVLALLYLVGPLQVILTSLPSLTQANVSVEKIERLGISLTLDPGEAGPELPATAKPDWGSLELQGVVLRYPVQDADESQFTLGPIDLALRPGEVVFLAGGNGSGKTTLAKMVVGLYAPDSGRVVFDGAPVTDANRDDYRQHFSIVFSDHFLFDTLLGNDSPELDARARQYLADLHLQHKVRVAGGKLSTIELSQGQRKRLALLMAFLEDSPFFVFDEWAADQDPEFRKVFYYQVLPELRARGKTVLVISHDERYFHVGDRIIQLEYGKLVEERQVQEQTLALA
jgi:putative ATP-binding cassette transporter